MEQGVYGQIHELERDHWWYKGMFALCQDQLELHVFNGSKVTGKARILDVGCGTGFWTKKMDAYGPTAGLDNADEALNICRGRGLDELVKSSADSLPIKNTSCDLVTGLGVIEHLDNDRDLVKEAKRVLKPGGYVLFLTSAYMFLWSEHDVAAHHKRRYRKGELIKLMEGEGLEVVKASYANTFLFPLIAGVRILQSMVKKQGRTHTSESDDLKMPSPILNNVFYGLLAIETRLLRMISFPFGVNIFILARKKV
jgi:ubiquinone/menaquinone biosynthesis C-methylase UbiE